MLGSRVRAPEGALNFGTDSVAQLVEHNTFNVGVLGSSPSGITKYPHNRLIMRVFYFDWGGIWGDLKNDGRVVTDIYIDFDQRKVDEANRKVIDFLNGEKVAK